MPFMTPPISFSTSRFSLFPFLTFTPVAKRASRMLHDAAESVLHNGDGSTDKTLVVENTTPLCEGEVELHFQSGSRYVGSVLNGQLSGHGKYYYVPGGDVYEGEWEADMKHGHGTYTYASGDRYVGQWWMGKKRGRGKYTFANGDDYLGFWKDDKFHGYGVFSVLSSGNRYEGFWEDACRHGHGAFYFGIGDVYDGNWVRGVEEGLGILIQSNGSIYCGGWIQGEMDGKGILRVQRKLYAVEYTNGRAISQVPIAAGAKPAAEWLGVYDHYVNYMGISQLHGEDNDSNVRMLDEFRSALEKLKIEAALWRKRYEGLVNEEAAGSMSLSDTAACKQNHQSLQWVQKEVEMEQGLSGHLNVPAYRIETSLVQQGHDQNVEEGGEDLPSRVQKISLLQNGACSINAVLGGVREATVGSEERKTTETLRRELIMLRQHNIELMRKNKELESQRTFLSTQNDTLMQSLSSCRAKIYTMDEQLFKTTAGEDAASADAMMLRGRVQELEKELAERKNHRNALVDGQRRQPAVGSLEAKLEEVNKANTELHRRCEGLKRDVRQHSERYQSLAEVMDNGHAEDVVNLQMNNKKLESRLEAIKEDLRICRVELDYRNSRSVELESLLLAMARRKTVDPNILRSLDRKMNHLQVLQESNAELSRQLEKVKEELEICRKGRRAARERTRSAEWSETSLEAELTQLRMDMKKVQKKNRKALADRGAIAEELFEEQLQHARAKRTLQGIQGCLTVVACIRGHKHSEEDPCVRVDEMDHSRLLLMDGVGTGEGQSFQFDVCFDANATWEAIFNEVCGPITTVMRGFHVAYVALGSIHTGKTTLLRGFLPLVFSHLRVKCSEYSPDKYTVTYKVAAVEVSALGAIDCSTGVLMKDVHCDAHGFVLPSGVTFLETTDVDVVSTVERLRQRQQQNHRSHMWIQIQCIVLHRVRRTFTVGRVTLVDLCGPGPLLLQEDDLESARFANRSFGRLTAVLRALQERQMVVPYTESFETSLLSDVFGGNAMTTVLGIISSARTDAGECSRVLHALKMASEVVNGPLLPKFVSSDELRWRDTVSATCSVEAAQPLLTDVRDLRDL